MGVTLVAIITLTMTVIPLIIGGIVSAVTITIIPPAVITTTIGVDIEPATRSGVFF
jgi:hypothetical protein